MPDRPWPDRARDIDSAVARARHLVGERRLAEFAADRERVEAVLWQFIIIGEASHHIDNDVKLRHSSLPWVKMRGMRNFLVHVYWAVRVPAIWDTVVHHLPEMAPALERLTADANRVDPDGRNSS